MGKVIQTIEELDAVLHWRGKHAQAIRERDALQALLTAADERADVLEGLLLQTNELLYAIQGDPGSVPSSAIDAMRGEVFTALKPSEGGGDAARLALRPENQRITPVRFKCIACGEYHEGSGNLPCPSMSPYSRIEQ